MSTTAQQKRPLRGHNRSHIQNVPEHKVELPAPKVSLPNDMYLHTPTYDTANPNGCSTEWWWHIGTLKTATGRVFGFEINAAAFYPLGFTEVMLTDVKNGVHYHETKSTFSVSKDWAESDPSKPWKVNLEDVSMSAPEATEPTKNMKVKASLDDAATKATVSFDLTLSQEGKPFFVWGTGEAPNPPKPIKYDNNFYFSLTRIQANGTITITPENGTPEIHNVTGVTWMDHEWGKFGNHGKGVKWILQDMQLDNGITISSYSMKTPVLHETSSGVATVQVSAEGGSFFVPTKLKPTKSTTIEGKEYFTEVSVEVEGLGSFVVKTLFPDQVFDGGVYEGVGSVTGTVTLDGVTSDVSGTAWLEQTN
ncbi:lipocalin-like domain-containing protein [uncultured Kordia sp.]|uniref:lipocalin-like domain-containing protein n=1 Tax=uncultured Kordia sp. TaxID=507699 RepID=UPI0026244390|nr:lipocalin-like domain-containing protein [uncultured Kordia sp.]